MSHPFDHNIPVLTEVFADGTTRKPALPPPVLDQVEAPVEAPQETYVALPDDDLIQDEPVPDADAIGAELEALATDSWTEPEWRLLEQRIAARVLEQLDARIDATLDQQLRDSLADVLQSAMTTLSLELRTGLQQAIGQTVTRAVAHELAQLKSLHRH